MSISALVGAVIAHTLTKSLDLSRPQDVVALAFSQEFVTGAGAGQCDNIFHDRSTLAGGANETLDLNGRALFNALGDAIELLQVKVVAVKNLSPSQILTVGGSNAPVNLFGTGSHTVNLPPGGFMLLTSPQTGWTVTPTTGDGLKIVNSAGDSADYEVIIMGSSS